MAPANKIGHGKTTYSSIVLKSKAGKLDNVQPKAKISKITSEAPKLGTDVNALRPQVSADMISPRRSPERITPPRFSNPRGSLFDQDGPIRRQPGDPEPRRSGHYVYPEHRPRTTPPRRSGAYIYPENRADKPAEPRRSGQFLYLEKQRPEKAHTPEPRRSHYVYPENRSRTPEPRRSHWDHRAEHGMRGRRDHGIRKSAGWFHKGGRYNSGRKDRIPRRSFNPERFPAPGPPDLYARRPRHSTNPERGFSVRQSSIGSSDRSGPGSNSGYRISVQEDTRPSAFDPLLASYSRKPRRPANLREIHAMRHSLARDSRLSTTSALQGIPKLTSRLSTASIASPSPLTSPTPRASPRAPLMMLGSRFSQSATPVPPVAGELKFKGLVETPDPEKWE
jgi:hypothetical protein